MNTVNIQGFKVLSLQFSSISTSYHNLFIKEHSVRQVDDSKPEGQTLFILNIPPYANENSIINAFSAVGNIKKVIFDDSEENFRKCDGFKKAYVVFNSREALLKALKLNNINVMSTSENPLKLGIEKWIGEYNDAIQDPDELQNEIDEFMNNFDENQKSSKAINVDNEGWTVVTKSGRKPGLSRKESVVNKIDDKTAKKMKKKELKNFYTFQKRETQMKNIADLRKNYEEAKNKVKLMKAARKFKPY